MLEKYRAYSPRHSPSLTMRTSVRFPPVLPWAFIYISLRLWATVAWCSISYSSDPQLPPFLGREKFSQRTQLRESSSYSRHISWLVGFQGTLETRLPMAWSISRSRIFKASGERRYIVVYRFFFFFHSHQISLPQTSGSSLNPDWPRQLQTTLSAIFICDAHPKNDLDARESRLSPMQNWNDMATKKNWKEGFQLKWLQPPRHAPQFPKNWDHRNQRRD